MNKLILPLALFSLNVNAELFSAEDTLQSIALCQSYFWQLEVKRLNHEITTEEFLTKTEGCRRAINSWDAKEKAQTNSFIRELVLDQGKTLAELSECKKEK